MSAAGARVSRLPLFASMLGFGLACLVAAELVNIGVIFALPRPEPEIYRLQDVERLLQGGAISTAAAKTLKVDYRKAPPEAPQPEDFRHRLEQRIARDLGVPADSVVFARELPWAPLSVGPPVPPGGPSKRRRERREPPRLFNLAAPAGPDQPVVIGPFKAGVKQPDGRWRVVETKTRLLLDPWRQRILLWFLASNVAMAPLAYLFARRVSAPIAAFAAAAERLGRDPNAPALELAGSAEVGQAAQAFNDMQERLRRYVQDRTSMIGAVAHDLRTPLTRLRFHIESAPAATRAKMAADIAEMDAMVAATLAFVRDATQAGPHARLELSSLVEVVAEDFSELGRDVRVTQSEPVVIEGDSLALKRLFTNLVDNAVKFGGLARIHMSVEGGSALVDVEDDGPGLPEAAMERVFEPFHRAEPSRSRDTGGIGLGLSVARSIARAHGGDVILSNRAGGGFRARVQLPM